MSDGLLVRGGEGGTAVSLAELAELAALLRDAARALGLAESSLRAATMRLRTGAELAPAAGARALAALEGALGRAVGLGGEVDGLAEAAVRARRLYEHAELSALGLVDAVRGARWPLLPLPRLDDVLRPLGWAMALDPQGWPFVRLRVVGEPDRPVAPPAGLGDLIAGIDALYPSAGGEAGSLEVCRIERPGGATSWAVLIPGTETLAFGGANPMDDATNLQAYVGAPNAMAVAVVAALGAAGVRRGEPVLLAGHSQGGLVAMRLAAEPAVRRRYSITTVLTAGTPAGHLPTPAGVSVLHLEHAGDPVPMLDAAVNPDEPDRTTVWHRGGAHDASSYARTAGLVDDSTHPSVVGWRERAAAVLGGEGATATSTAYGAERLDPAAAVEVVATGAPPRGDAGG
jgi:pimeloyl-ACP methyl ester carboxylesterase